MDLTEDQITEFLRNDPTFFFNFFSLIDNSYFFFIRIMFCITNND